MVLKATNTESSPPTPNATDKVHLAVFVHGLWGSPSHLNHLSTSLKAQHPDLHIHVAKRNAGNFTYDGVETGGERVTNEVEDEIAEIKKSGKDVNRISFIGYSMGGLVARYSIGLLYAKGLLGSEPGKIKPVNFTTFATPHLGTRTPLIGWQNNVWNALGARSLSASGEQMWCIDKFRDTERPLLSVMADRGSIFMRGLELFRKRSLYANIVNDRAVPFYTAHISDIDPFVDPSALKIDYEPGYDDIILKPSLATPKDTPATWTEQGTQVLRKMPFYLAVGVFAPIGGLVFLGNAAVQSFQSAERIKQHEAGTAGVNVSTYRSSPILESVQRQADHVLKRLNSAEGEDFLESSAKMQEEKQDVASGSSSAVTAESSETAASGTAVDGNGLFPRLALTKEQFEMKAAFDALGIEKYAVHIKSANHSHAAIIIRTKRPGFGDGKVVSRHWLEHWQSE